MITCRHVCDTASDYLDEPPGIMTRLSLLFHLLICKHCRRYLHQLRISNDASGDLPGPAAPDDQEIDHLIERLKNS